MGVDWRADMGGGPVQVEGSVGHDTGERPPLPYGWPAPDAALLEALDDLGRLDAAQNAMYAPGSRREGDTVPGYAALEEARSGALDRLAKTRAESLTGLQAKARAILTPSVADNLGGSDDIAESLARDLLGVPHNAVELRPDPIHAAIEESRRLYDAWTATEALPLLPGSIDPRPETNAASAAFHRQSNDVLLKTVPTTARGCAALARYVAEFAAANGWQIDETAEGDANMRVLGLIARSPLL